MPSQLGISTMSLGRCWAGHSFEHKMDMAAKYGYAGIELWHEDLMDIADRYPNGGAASLENQKTAARYVRSLCDARNLTILCLQPFALLEGAIDPAVHPARLQELEHWMELTRQLGTDLIHIASSMAPASELSADLELAVTHLRAAGELALRQNPPVRLSYESLAWGSRVDKWEQSWDIVKAVDLPNFGLCLDTFNIAGRIFADPSRANGCTEDAQKAVDASMKRLVASVDVSRVFFVQVVDAALLAEPLLPGHKYYDPAQPCRMSWSRNCRLFYGETEYGAYLPVKQISAAIFKGLGFEGWVSLELFNKRMSETDKGVPEELARRGAESWDRLVADMDLTVASKSAKAVVPATMATATPIMPAIAAGPVVSTVAVAATKPVRLLPRAQKNQAAHVVDGSLLRKALPASVYVLASSMCLYLGLILV
ncbi:3-dehydroshikimate dehydratase [Ceratocystis platani]|uniref:3-dehydroshikimate dehydratase n=1 Tax=Ceratocystis fimbriata f. sp. platani TaxID=88771 RepID=A0A0F8AWJ3_CERFI|nr:3-dehydroshikimate dehydratase [Ceratocystis platani]